ncbi:MAG: hypothetical protein ACI8ZB_003144 [Desulforhopalus sp.]|jgi:hypothetical protein
MTQMRTMSGINVTVVTSDQLTIFTLSQGNTIGVDDSDLKGKRRSVGTKPYSIYSRSLSDISMVLLSGASDIE